MRELIPTVVCVAGCLGGCVFDTAGLGVNPRGTADAARAEAGPQPERTAEAVEAPFDGSAPERESADLHPDPPSPCSPSCKQPEEVCCELVGDQGFACIPLELATNCRCSAAYNPCPAELPVCCELEEGVSACRPNASFCLCLDGGQPCGGSYPVCCVKSAGPAGPRCYSDAESCECDPFDEMPCAGSYAPICCRKGNDKVPKCYFTLVGCKW